MSNTPKLTVTCGLLAFLASAGFAQSAAEQGKYYQLDFVVKELEGGKTVNARHYWTTTTTGEHPACSIRTGSKVPISTGDKDTNFTYIDLGVSMDCSFAHEIDGSLGLTVTAEISSAAAPGSIKQPVIRQNKWNGKVILPFGKPTPIFSADDLASKGQIQIELTATPVK